MLHKKSVESVQDDINFVQFRLFLVLQDRDQALNERFDKSSGRIIILDNIFDDLFGVLNEGQLHQIVNDMRDKPLIGV